MGVVYTELRHATLDGAIACQRLRALGQVHAAKVCQLHALDALIVPRLLRVALHIFLQVATYHLPAVILLLAVG